MKKLWWSETSRSSLRRCSIKKGVLKNLSKFRIRPAKLLKKRLRNRCFSVHFVKFLRAPFLQNTSGCLLRKDRHWIHPFMKFTGDCTLITITKTFKNCLKNSVQHWKLFSFYKCLWLISMISWFYWFQLKRCELEDLSNRHVNHGW